MYAEPAADPLTVPAFPRLAEEQPDPIPRETAALPTSHLPGSEGKLGVLEARASCKLPLFHPQDAKLPDRVGYLPGWAQGAGAVAALVEQTAEGYRVVERKRGAQAKRPAA